MLENSVLDGGKKLTTEIFILMLGWRCPLVSSCELHLQTQRSFPLRSLSPLRVAESLFGFLGTKKAHTNNFRCKLFAKFK